jgi:hypothetical protein
LAFGANDVLNFTSLAVSTTPSDWKSRRLRPAAKRPAAWAFCRNAAGQLTPGGASHVSCAAAASAHASAAVCSSVLLM